MSNVVNLTDFKPKVDKQKERLIEELDYVSYKLTQLEKESFDIAMKAQEYLNEAMVLTFHLSQHETNDDYLKYIFPQLEFDF